MAAARAPTTTVTIQSRPANIFGATTMSLGSTTTLSNDGSPVGIWTSSNSNVATINSVTGFVTSGITSGTTTITASNVCGSTNVIFTIAAPTAIAGAGSFCQNATLQLSDGVSGGVWSSSNTNNLATIDPVTGTVYGIAAGGVGCIPITYTITGGCFTTTTVCTTTAPGPVTGLFAVCQGLTTSVADVTTGGVWSSNNTDISITPTGTGNTATVLGVSAGTSVIDYFIGSCSSTHSVVVNPLPANITGPAKVCVNSTVTLSDASTLGSWSLSNTHASIDAVLGTVTGLSGFALDTITYKLGTGCLITTTIAVNPLLCCYNRQYGRLCRVHFSTE